MRDDQLSALLRSPSLELEPPPDLAASVRTAARRAQHRRRAGLAVLSVCVLVLAGLAGPDLVGGGRRAPDSVATDPGDPRFPDAQTPVVVLTELNGGEVVTFFQDGGWCTAAVRVGTSRACTRAVGREVPPFAFVRAAGHETLTVDRDSLVAGVLGTGVDRVRVRLSDGRELPAGDVEAEGFPRPVWWLQVPAGVSVEGYTALDAAGEVVQARTP